MKTIAIAQARIGSSRLPAKVMLSINGMTMLEIFVKRLRQSKLLDDIIIATTVNPQDDIIVEECKRIGVTYFRGDELNVLSRYYNCAKEYYIDNIVRVTSDCPLIDAEVLDEGIKIHLKKNFDYTSNAIEKTFPHGFDYQIFKFAALEKAFFNAKDPYEIEHVMPYIHKRPELFSRCSLKNLKTPNASDIRITLDYLEDYKTIHNVFKNFNYDIFKPDCVNIFELYKKKPELFICIVNNC